MSTPDYCTLDGDLENGVYPYTPGVSDMGGAAFVDDDTDPPIPEENVMARDINQMQLLIVRACRMMPKASFHIQVVDDVASLVGFRACSDTLESADINVLLADPFSTGNAVVQIRWPLHSIPVAAVGPSVTRITTAHADSTTLHVSQFTDSTYAYALINAGTLAEFEARVDVDGEGTFGVPA